MTKKIFNPYLFDHELTEANIAVGKCIDNILMVANEIIRCDNERVGNYDGHFVIGFVKNQSLKEAGIAAIHVPKGSVRGYKFKLLTSEGTIFLQPYQLSVHVLRGVHKELMDIYDKI